MICVLFNYSNSKKLVKPFHFFGQAVTDFKSDQIAIMRQMELDTAWKNTFFNSMSLLISSLFHKFIVCFYFINLFNGNSFCRT